MNKIILPAISYMLKV